jgi:hypothetical protein
VVYAVEHVPQGDGVDGWLADARGADGSGAGRDTVRAPPVGAGEVVVSAGREADVRDHPGAPLPGEDAAQLRHRTGDVHAREPDRNERGVPAPLVRVQVRRGGGHRAEVVAVQGLDRGMPDDAASRRVPVMYAPEVGLLFKKKTEVR